jgi:WD40 repeat protein
MDTKDLLNKYEPTKDVKTISAEPQIRVARFSPCGKVIVAGGFDGRVRRWNCAADGLPELPPLNGHHAWIDGLAFRAEGEFLFTADSWGQLACWSGYTSEQPAAIWRHEQAHDGWLRDLAVSPDGKLLASCGSDRVCRVWSIDDGKKQHELAAYGQDLLHVLWAPDGTLLTGDDRGIVKQWRLDGSLVRQFDASVLYSLSRLQDVGGVHALAIDREGKLLAAGGVIPKNGGTVTGVPTLLVFDVATGEQKQKYALGKDQDCFVADVRFHDEGFLAAVTYGTPGSGQLLYVALDDPNPFFTKKLSNAHSLSWHPDGKRLAVVTTNPGSNGNGRPLDKDGNYKGNKSPILVFRVAGETAAAG